MGNLVTRVWGKLFLDKEARILMLGLDAAGKTSVLYRLSRNEDVTTIPTLGFNVESFKYKKVSMEAWDLGGQTGIRRLWKHYYRNTDAVIFVVDSNDTERFVEVRETIQLVISNEELKGVKLLVFCNKQDLPNAVSAQKLVEELRLNRIQKDIEWYVQPCSAKSGEGLFEGLDWLSSKL